MNNNLLLALASAALIACTQVEVQKPETVGEMTLSATIGTPTRTAVGEGNAVVWSEGDVIGVIGSEPPAAEFTLQSGAGSTSGSFSGIAPANAKYAVYPFPERVATGYGNAVISWNSSEQHAVKDSYDPAAALMAGMVSNGSVSFKNLVSYIKFYVEFPCASISFTSSTGDIVCNNVMLSTKDNCLVLDPEITTGSATVTLLPAEGQEAITKGTYLLAILPNDEADTFVINITTASGAELTSRRLSFKHPAGHISNIGDINASKFESISSSLIGSGTREDPFLIGTADQFHIFVDWLHGVDKEKYLGMCYKQVADIDLGGETINASGTEPFTGVYSGGGHKLSNLKLKGETYSYSIFAEYYVAALFPVAMHATIHDLTLEATGFQSGTRHSTAIYGGIVGMNITQGLRTQYLHLVNCTFNRFGPDIDTTGDQQSLEIGKQTVMYGGMIGYAGAHVNCEGCTNNAPVWVNCTGRTYTEGYDYIFGGLVGYVKSTTTEYTVCIGRYCRNNADICVQGAYGDCIVGGIVGKALDTWQDDAVIRLANVENHGNILAAGIDKENGKAYAGGIIGLNDSDGFLGGAPSGLDPRMYNILNCCASVTATQAAESFTGGIMGWCYDEDTKIGCICSICQLNPGNLVSKVGHYGSICGNDHGEFYDIAVTHARVTDNQMITDETHIHGSYLSTENGNSIPASVMNLFQQDENAQFIVNEMHETFTFDVATWTGTWTGFNEGWQDASDLIRMVFNDNSKAL